MGCCESADDKDYSNNGSHSETAVLLRHQESPVVQYTPERGSHVVVTEEPVPNDKRYDEDDDTISDVSEVEMVVEAEVEMVVEAEVEAAVPEDVLIHTEDYQGIPKDDDKLEDTTVTKADDLATETQARPVTHDSTLVANDDKDQTVTTSTESLDMRTPGRHSAAGMESNVQNTLIAELSTRKGFDSSTSSSRSSSFNASASGKGLPPPVAPKKRGRAPSASSGPLSSSREAEPCSSFEEPSRTPALQANTLSRPRGPQGRKLPSRWQQ